MLTAVCGWSKSRLHELHDEAISYDASAPWSVRQSQQRASSFHRSLSGLRWPSRQARAAERGIPADLGDHTRTAQVAASRHRCRHTLRHRRRRQTSPRPNRFASRLLPPRSNLFPARRQFVYEVAQQKARNEIKISKVSCRIQNQSPKRTCGQKCILCLAASPRGTSHLIPLSTVYDRLPS